MSFVREFFAPETPAGFWPGDLLAQIAERDLTQMEHSNDGSPGSIKTNGMIISVHERVRRDFLQHTAIAVFRMGRVEGNAKVRARHTGSMKRTGVRFEGEKKFVGALQSGDVIKTLLPLDFTRLEIFGTSEACGIEIETYGASRVVMRIPRVRRYVPLGSEQRAHLMKAFGVISKVLPSISRQQTQ